MSWFSISLPNPFKSQEEEEEEEEKLPEDENDSHVGGVKEDLSELSKTIGQKLFGVASFLASPPLSNESTHSPSSSPPSQALLGIRNDFVEIGGSFKTGLSRLSTILHLHSDDLPTDSGAGIQGSRVSDVVGITEEVLELARDLSTRPESWLDFPLPLSDDFDMSISQGDHAATIEHLAPSLAALKNGICPFHMSEGCFWKIYFVLLNPRLNEHDSEILSTPQIVEAWQQLQNRTNTQLKSPEVDYLSVEASKTGRNIQEENIEIQEKDILSETVTVASQVVADEHDTTEQWLEEDGGTVNSVVTRKQLGNEEDVSFSDLEDDDDGGLSRDTKSRSGQDAQDSSPSGSNEWVQLSKKSDIHATKHYEIQPTSQEKNSEADESSDWLDVDDFD
ncbi:uncharacterized protein LOC143879448 [Tasmannia lanceolata]|uniref:uncharacterized protein LOC143879448 n=1 Tax=Tasmannia lanceolata TaxID=3420 RepID=UPI004062D42B